MHRRATKDITLSDGLKIAKGNEVEMPCFHGWDISVYPEANEFIPDRFLKIRQAPDHESLHQLVSTSLNHMGFGYGKYACPGRFFAANQVKIALCHILMKCGREASAPPDGRCTRSEYVRTSRDPQTPI